MGKNQGKQNKRKADVHDNERDLDSGVSTSARPDASPFDTIATSIKTSRYVQALLGLTIIGFLLRFYNLAGNSLWLDEASTLSFARQSLLGIWESTAGGEFNPPLFYWLEHGMLVFGESEFVLRFLPALLGVLTIPVVYYIGSEFRDRNVGLIAAALLAFSPFHIYYS